MQTQRDNLPHFEDQEEISSQQDEAFSVTVTATVERLVQDNLGAHLLSLHKSDIIKEQ